MTKLNWLLPLTLIACSGSTKTTDDTASTDDTATTEDTDLTADHYTCTLANNLMCFDMSAADGWTRSAAET